MQHAALPGALANYGWSPTIAFHYEPHDAPDHQPVRVARVDRGAALVATPGGLGRARLVAGLDPATGDWAVARLVPDAGLVLAALLPRRTAVTRTNAAGSGQQVLAANVDTIFVLHGIDRPHRVGRLERLSILTWDAGARPVVVLTKSDLEGSPEAAISVAGAVAEIRRVLAAVDVHAVSSTTGAGVETLDPYLQPGATVGLLGESGAGKSSLVNRLLGREAQRVGATRRGDHKGRHTTTARELLPLPGGAVLMDTPGLRMVAMTGDDTGLGRAYADVEALFAGCRFRDCAHRREPGCAVRAALGDGTLPAARWAGYQKLLREIAYEERRASQRARRAEEREWGRRLRDVRNERREEW